MDYKTILQYEKFMLHSPYNFEAIHNKDYSVVKTFKSLSSYNTGAFFTLQHECIS